MKTNRFYDPDPMNAAFLLCSECGGECYELGVMYTWAKRRHGVWEDVLVCPSCMEELFDELPLDEKAKLLGSRKVVVGEDERRVIF